MRKIGDILVLIALVITTIFSVIALFALSLAQILYLVIILAVNWTAYKKGVKGCDRIWLIVGTIVSIGALLPLIGYILIWVDELKSK